MSYCEQACNFDPIEGLSASKNDPLTLMWMMPPRSSGSTGWDFGGGDDSEDPSGVFSGQEADQADLPGTAGFAEYGAEGDPIRRDGVYLRADHSAVAEDRALERHARRDAGGERRKAQRRATDPHPHL